MRAGEQLKKLARRRTEQQVVNHGLNARNDDFPISLAASVLDAGERKEAVMVGLQALGELGVKASSYERVDDLGNGLQVVGRQRILVSERDGYPTYARRKQAPTSEGFTRSYADLTIDKHRADGV